MMRRKLHYSCVNCGFEGAVAVKGLDKLLWVVILAIVWNAWLFHHVGMEWEALGACVFALVCGWVAFKLPRWVECPACRWKHPLDALEEKGR